jgi:hypothetical protein
MICNTNSEALHSHGHPPSSPPRTTGEERAATGPGRINHEELLREDRLLGLYPATSEIVVLVFGLTNV